MKPTSLDLRRRILAARLNDHQSMGQIAQRFRIAKGTVQNILERYREAGTVEAKPPNAGRKPAFRGAGLKRLEHEVLEHPDATLAQLRERSGLGVSLVTVHNTLKRLGFTLKTSPCALRNRAGRTWPASAGTGNRRWRTRTRHASSSSTKPARRPT